MIRRKTAARGVALAAALGLTLTACGSDDPADEAASEDPLTIGTILPVTGNLSQLGPPEIAGVGLAIEDINAAGGVLGQDVEVVWGDSGDPTDMSVATSTASDHISKGVDAAIGPAASGVAVNIVDTYVEAGIPLISPANTSNELTGYSPFYARTAPPDTVQGSALGNLILEDGHQKVAFLVFNDPYGTGLRDQVETTVTNGGGEVVYGGNGAGHEFPPLETNFGASVSAALATEPDALVIIAFEETQAAVTELVAQSWDFNGTTYFTDGNLQDHQETFDPGTLAGVKGTLPGAQSSDDFKARLDEWYSANQDGELKDYSYSAESYDATILAALAAVRGEGADGTTISENIKAVSGAEGGTPVSSFEEGVAALENDEEIHYTGPSGIGPLNESNDPSSATIGIYEYGEDNAYTWVSEITGNI